ncbi:multicopper oxidase [Zalerion maritima]|uniref:laccase n=1 Tax=Zalerion maritima TaxID=339359 RepID=A0AAD5WU20_9PEZI|nr:multicopper oxidase [Zalerion maritima]
MLFGSVFLGLLSIAGIAKALPSPNSSPRSLDARGSKGKHDGGKGYDNGKGRTKHKGPGKCRNGRRHGGKNRECWVDDFNIYTDYEEEIPYTGNTVTYALELTEVDDWTGADGQPKEVAMLINGGFPGPTIEANWGDEIEITVSNNLVSNGTSIHWHGIRMLDNNINDGVNGITECPIPPGSSKKYKFMAQQYGTSWYHSHFSTQYANGVVGTMIIHGPSSKSYDVDLGVLSVTDWYYAEAEATAAYVQTALDAGGGGGAPPSSNNILFNGHNVSPDGSTGAYERMTLTKGKSHRVRLVNPSVDNSFTLNLQGHDMTIIQSDFVPVKPYTTDSVFLPVGARLDVIIEANQKRGNYWFNATLGTFGACGASDIPYPAMIFSYRGAGDGLPTDEGEAPADKKCADSIELEPIVKRTASLEGFDPVDVVDIDLSGNATHIYWNVHGQPMNVNWGKPSLEYIKNGDSFEAERNVFAIADDPEWTVWVIQNNFGVPHPMHLHGHDFLVLGKSEPYDNPFSTDATVRTFDAGADSGSLNLDNPTRRDVTMLPGLGWLVIAFRTDNPGAWVMHCHIAWHVGQGLSLQYLERQGEIASTMDLDELDENCDAWNAYPHPYPQIDSGLRV